MGNINELFNVEKFKFIDRFFKYIDYSEFKDNKKYLLLDLRTTKEFNYKHLERSVHFPLLEDDISIKLEGMFENKTYISTAVKSIFYIIPRLYKINKEIKKYEDKNVIVLACRHARIRSRFIAAFVNLFGSNVVVLRNGVNTMLKINKKEILYNEKVLTPSKD